MPRRIVPVLSAALLFAAGCKSKTSGAPPVPRASASALAQPETPKPAKSAAPEPADEPDPKRYAWLTDDSRDFPPAVDTLAARFESPPSYQRVELAPGSFGAWLRHLPLAATGTPVKTHKGDVVHPGNDQYLAAVVAMDAGKIDLQQSPDVILRLHAEWLWSRRDKNISYRSATGLDLPLSRWARGERLKAAGASVFWVVKGKPAELEHSDFREFLDTVFTWANSISVAQEAAPVEAKDLQPGDFFIHLGSPGHTLLVLDLARKPNGHQVALLGQALNPAQNVFVLQAGRATAWFTLRPGEPVITPYTDEFTWEGLRRLGIPEPK